MKRLFFTSLLAVFFGFSGMQACDLEDAMLPWGQTIVGAISERKSVLDDTCSVEDTVMRNMFLKSALADLNSEIKKAVKMANPTYTQVLINLKDLYFPNDR